MPAKRNTEIPDIRITSLDDNFFFGQQPMRGHSVKTE